MIVPRKIKQPFLPFTPLELVPANVVVIQTDDIDIHTPEGARELIMRMRAVPLNKSILLDYLVGRKRGTPHHCEECAEFHRLQSLLNSRYRSKRFDFFGDSFTAKLFRESVRQMPKFMEEIRSKRIELEVRKR
jgi:hypothetical protein